MTDQTETAGARDAVIDLAARVIHDAIATELGIAPGGGPSITDLAAAQALARRGLLVPVELWDDRAREATPMCCDERDALQRRIDKALAGIGQWWGTAQRGDRVLMVVNSILRGQVDEPTEPSTSDLSGRWVGGQFQPFQPGEGPS